MKMEIPGNNDDAKGTLFHLQVTSPLPERTTGKKVKKKKKKKKKIEENSDLPCDVLDIISEKLDLDDLLHFSGVCKRVGGFLTKFTGQISWHPKHHYLLKFGVINIANHHIPLEAYPTKKFIGGRWIKSASGRLNILRILVDILSCFACFWQMLRGICLRGFRRMAKEFACLSISKLWLGYLSDNGKCREGY
ncbi:unnamed protein product [Trifolium pratense]|uniref:Uncharacterized protein n=1 Tax=Trifolium pratense TaxID=57577 RepID=A0ACB0IAD6_TRIPR|nr:unnamed protein product [Trifolium pratense]